LWRDEEKFKKSYMTTFPGYYETSDGGFIDEDGYIYIMGRVDDVINIAGHRLSTGAMEEVVATHPDVAECAVFGTADQLKGQLPVGLVVLKAGRVRESAELAGELAQMVRDKIGPIACYRITAVVNRLPKTRSGKILRGTIDDPLILDEITATLKGLGFAG
jgi:propionyl-CoA synthetase